MRRKLLRVSVFFCFYLKKEENVKIKRNIANIFKTSCQWRLCQLYCNITEVFPEFDCLRFFFCPIFKSCLVFGLIWNFSPFGPLPYFPSSPSFSRGSPPANWFWAALYYPPYKAEARLPINRPMLSNSTRAPPHNFYWGWSWKIFHLLTKQGSKPQYHAIPILKRRSSM